MIYAIIENVFILLTVGRDALSSLTFSHQVKFPRYLPVSSTTFLRSFTEPMAPDIMSSYGSAESLQDWTHFNFTIGTDVAILQGSPMTIKCPVIGVPEPKIGWIKDGKMLTSNDRMDMDCVGTLNINKLELEDSGDYVCTAQSFLGMDIAFSAVTVIGKNGSYQSNSSFLP